MAIQVGKSAVPIQVGKSAVRGSYPVIAAPFTGEPEQTVSSWRTIDVDGAG